MSAWVSATYMNFSAGGYVSMQTSPAASYLATRRIERGQVRHTIELGRGLMVDVDKHGFVLGVEQSNRSELTLNDIAEVLRSCKLEWA